MGVSPSKKRYHHAMTLTIRFLGLAILFAACGDDSAAPGTDGGRRDSGSRDAAVRDAGTTPLTDAGFDAGATADAGELDAGSIDAGGTDAGGADAGGPDDGGPAMVDAGECPDPADPHVMYVARTPAECALVRFTCAMPFYTAFSNDCGCGCLFECPAEGTPGITYHSRDPVSCRIITVVCPDGDTQFLNECGCGCVSGRMP
jgi:hypothetical protein